jgi:hypothetical protein
MTTKYGSKPLKYCPTGGKSNGKRNMYEPGTCEQTYYTEDEFEFLKAIDAYKHEHDRQFPTYHEILKVLKSLGYRKEPDQCLKSPPTDSSSPREPIAASAPSATPASHSSTRNPTSTASHGPYTFAPNAP